MYGGWNNWLIIILTIFWFKYNHTLEPNSTHRISERNILGQIGRGEMFTTLKLFLTTRETYYTKVYPIQLRNFQSLLFTSFDLKQKTIFIIPGWQSTKDLDWTWQMKTELLLNSNFNIFEVIWADYATNLYYPKAVYDTKQVGLELSEFINYLEQVFGYPLASIHLIGFSLGAHIAGFAGSALEGKIGRITGLDPAGPNFVNAPIESRLDAKDAKFVDVIHSSGGLYSFGTSTKSGHIDFYPNGGIEQPSCGWKLELKILLSPFESYREFQNKSILLGCNHRKALEYFIESINSQCQFLASTCRCYDDFLKNKCLICFYDNSEICISMGFYARWGNQNAAAYGYYLKTSNSPPYCIKNAYNTNFGRR